MARERGSSVLNVYTDYASFLGPKVPEEVKRMVSKLEGVSEDKMDRILKAVIQDMQGSPEDPEFFESLVDEITSQETVSLLYSGILSLLKAAFRAPVASLKKDLVKKELLELKFPKQFVEKIISTVFSDRGQEIEKMMLKDSVKLPCIDQLRWRLDVGISTSALARVLEPTILMEIKTTSGEKQTFEVSQSAFHDLRYSVAYVLKEMEDLGRRSILKIQT